MDEPSGPRPRIEDRPANACFRCGTDYGSVVLPRIAGLPVCDGCARILRNRPFPGWIRIAFGALILLAVLAFVYNQRFFLAHVEMQRALRALKSGNVERAVALFDEAAERVPDEPGLQALARYFRALMLVGQERSAEAIPLLKEALAINPNEPTLAAALLQAEAGLAYEQKDYDRFLEVEQTVAKKQPDNPIAALGVASAHACRYAATGDEAAKDLAERQIESASKMKGAEGPEFAEYLDRIRYRLETREIISRNEYLRRFPNGRRAKDGG
jgi:tetratricopeptide (TPR) repeat protein